MLPWNNGVSEKLEDVTNGRNVAFIRENYVNVVAREESKEWL